MSLDAHSYFEYMKSLFRKCFIDIHNCVAQTYDGANVMSGKLKGVQALFQAEVAWAIYIHCLNHSLNLVLVDVCKNVDPAKDFFD